MGKFDGILGLAWPGISVDGVPTPLQAMVRSLDAPVFAFSLGDEKAGELVLGGVDSTKYAGSFHYVPLQSKTYWEIKLEGLAVGAANMTRATRAIVDSGTSLLAGPKDGVKRVAKAVGAKPALAGEYTIACDAKAPDITFVLGAGATTWPSRTASSRSRWRLRHDGHRPAGPGAAGSSATSSCASATSSSTSARRASGLALAK